MGAGWLLCEGWMLDEESGYWDVQRPGAGSYVAFEPPSGARLIEPERSPFLPPTFASGYSSYEELLAETEHDLRQSIRAIAALPLDDRVLALSGGKDSRTLTALILDEGLQDRFRFVTHGSPEGCRGHRRSPDRLTGSVSTGRWTTPRIAPPRRKWRVSGCTPGCGKG